MGKGYNSRDGRGECDGKTKAECHAPDTGKTFSGREKNSSDSSSPSEMGARVTHTDGEILISMIEMMSSTTRQKQQLRTGVQTPKRGSRCMLLFAGRR